MNRDDDFVIGGERIAIGERRDIEIVATQSPSGHPIMLPITVRRGDKPGPAVFVTAAVHGDELNGTGVVRELILRSPFELLAGTLVLVPVANILGFERHTRYLPDRRDLNRCFPGNADGSLSARFAHLLFKEIVRKCDYGIDLHTAAVRRTNYPNVRADMGDDEVARLARAFGCELILNNKGPTASLRREACKAGVPTIIVEAGEVWKIEGSIIEIGVRGVWNVLIELGMTDGQRTKPAYQVVVRKTKWIRANHGGMLEFHVSPGSLVERDQPLATNSSLLGVEHNVVTSPTAGVILGMTTLPSVIPGDPICNLAVPRGGIKSIRAAYDATDEDSLHDRVIDDLATNLQVQEPMIADDNGRDGHDH